MYDHFFQIKVILGSHVLLFILTYRYFSSNKQIKLLKLKLLLCKFLLLETYLPSLTFWVLWSTCAFPVIVWSSFCCFFQLTKVFWIKERLFLLSHQCVCSPKFNAALMILKLGISKLNWTSDWLIWENLRGHKKKRFVISAATDF